MNPVAMLRDMRTIKLLLDRAEAVAREMGEEEPGADHLLLAAFDLPDGAAARILAEFGADRGRLRDATVAQEADALVTAGIEPDAARRLAGASPLDGAPGTGPYRSRPSAQEAFTAAGALARASRERFGGAHVVAAVAAMEHGVASRALDRLGVDRSALRAAADRDRHSSRGR